MSASETASNLQPPHSRRPLLSRGQRIRFVLALTTVTLATLYSSVALLTRVTPALFKGQDFQIPVVHKVLAELPGPAKVEPPAVESIFNRRINILVIGVDRRPSAGAEQGGLADSLMVVSLDPISESITALSFPRDVLIEIQAERGGSFTDRINTSFQYGYGNGGQKVSAGAEQMKKDLKANFGIEIDHWVYMNIQGVQSLIDAVGGVVIDVPPELKVPWDHTDYWWYSDDDTIEHTISVAFPPGPQVVDGFHAVAFGRYRQDNDFNRVKRQQVVLRAAIQAVFSRGILSKSVIDIYDVYARFVQHDVAVSQAVSYLPLLKKTGGVITTFSLADTVNGSSTVFSVPGATGSVLNYDRQNAQYILSQVFTSPRYAKSTVEVQDGRGGELGFIQVDALGRYLKFVRGLPAVSLGTEVPHQATTTITLYDERRRAVAEDIASWLGLPPGAITVARKGSEVLPDVMVTIGEDFVMPIS